MEIDPVNKAIIGGFFVIAGLIMVIFHKQASALDEDMFGNLRQFLPSLRPHGRALTVFTLALGLLSIIGGGLVLLLAIAS